MLCPCASQCRNRHRHCEKGLSEPLEDAVTSMELRADQRQSQTLSPRLQHAVRLLQMSSLDFAAQLHATLPSATGRIGPSGMLWVAYQKGGQELHRDSARKIVNQYGYDGVAMVAVDDVWSAIRLKKA